MLTELFVGWYDYDEIEFEVILKNSVISFDTNVLLNFYRYSKKTSVEMFKILEPIKSRIVTPYYVAKEFTHNRKNIKLENIRAYENLEKSIVEKFEEIIHEIEEEGDKKLSKMKDTIALIDTCKERIAKNISDEKKTKKDFYKGNDIEKKISELFFENYIEKYDDDKYEFVKKEGLKRFEDNIPPGYKDKNKDENGDYYIFKSLLDYCKEKGKDLIFVTNDKKEDWFRNNHGVKEPREELLEEFYKETGKKLLIFDFDTFVQQEIIFENKVSADIVDEIREVNKLEERYSSRGIQRVMKYMLFISSFDTIDKIEQNIIEIEKSLRTMKRICEGINESRMLETLNKMEFCLEIKRYEDYFDIIKSFDLKTNEIRSTMIGNIDKFYLSLCETTDVAYGYRLLENIMEYIRTYMPSNYENRMLLAKSRELKIGKRNNEIDDEYFMNETKAIYSQFNQNK